MRRPVHSHRKLLVALLAAMPRAAFGFMGQGTFEYVKKFGPWMMVLRVYRSGR